MCVGCLAQCPPTHSWLVNHAHDSDGMSALSSETGIDTEVCKGGENLVGGEGSEEKVSREEVPCSFSQWMVGGREVEGVRRDSSGVLGSPPNFFLFLELFSILFTL